MKKLIYLIGLVALAAVLFGCTQSGPVINMADLKTPAADSIGVDTAPVTVIEYSDYQCPLCRKWYLESKKPLIDEYVNTGKVKFVFKDFPLSGHPFSMPYAVAVRCAGEEGKYFEMFDKVYDEQDKLSNGAITTVTSVTLVDLSNWAKELGLDSNKFNYCLSSAKFDSAIQANEAEGSGIGVNGTPSFVVGKTNGSGVLVIGAVPYSTLKDQIEQALK